MTNFKTIFSYVSTVAACVLLFLLFQTKQSEKDLQDQIENIYKVKIQHIEKQISTIRLNNNLLQNKIDSSAVIISALEKELDKLRSDLTTIENEKQKLFDQIGKQTNAESFASFIKYLDSRTDLD